MDSTHPGMHWRELAGLAAANPPPASRCLELTRDRVALGSILKMQLERMRFRPFTSIKRGAGCSAIG